MTQNEQNPEREGSPQNAGENEAQEQPREGENSYPRPWERGRDQLLWTRISLEYGEHSAELAGDLVYSSESDDPAVDDVASTLLKLIREARNVHREANEQNPEEVSAWKDRTRVDRLAIDLENQEWTVDKITDLWEEAPAPADPGQTDSPEYLKVQREKREAEQHREERIEQTLDLEEQIQRRRVMARSTTDEELISALIEATAARPELIAYEPGEHQVQIYVLCTLDPEGYLNVLEVEGGLMRVGEPIEDYMAWLVDKLPVTGAALEEETTVWEKLPDGQGELEFYVDGDAAMLVDLPINAVTGLLFTYESKVGREIVAAPAGEWTLISAAPKDLMGLLGLLRCHAIIAEGNANQQHLVVREAPEHGDAEPEWPVQALMNPESEPVLEEFIWQTAPKRMNRPLTDDDLAAFDAELLDMLLELPASPLELSHATNFVPQEEEIEWGIETFMGMFGVDPESVTGRRLNAYLRDHRNTLALESVLQLLGVPTELALVPTLGFDVASISTARVFGEDPVPEPEYDTPTQEATDNTDNADEAANREDSWGDGYISPLDRSYRLVATNRRVTYGQWLEAEASGSIPYAYTHIGSPEGDSSPAPTEPPVRTRRSLTPEARGVLNAVKRGTEATDTETTETASAKTTGDDTSAVTSLPASAPKQGHTGATTRDPSRALPKSKKRTSGQRATRRSAHRSQAHQRRRRLTPEQIRAKTRRVGLALGIDVTAQSAIALALARAAHRRRARGQASRKLSVAATLFALNATVESALIPTVLRSFERTQKDKHARPVADAEVVHPGESGIEQPSGKRTLIDELREGSYRTADTSSGGEASTRASGAQDSGAQNGGLGGRVLGAVRKLRVRAAKNRKR